VDLYGAESRSISTVPSVLKNSQLIAIQVVPPKMLAMSVGWFSFLQGGPKKLRHFFVRLITSSNIEQFSNFFSLSESGENF